MILRTTRNADTTLLDQQATIVVAHNTARYLLMHYRQLLIDLSKQYDHVVCVTPIDGFEKGFSELGIEHRSITMQQHGMNPFVEWRLVAQFLALYKELQPNHVLNFSIKPCLYGGLASRMAKIAKSGYMVTGLGYVFLTQTWKVAVLRRVIVFWYTQILRKTDAIFFQNKDDAHLFSQLKITRNVSTHVLPGTGIDLDKFKTKKVMPLVDDEHVIRFLFIGRMLRDKGLYELIEACQILLNEGCKFECELLGPIDSNPSAIQLNEIQRWQDKGLITYSGEVQDVRPTIERSHVFVLPSYREGLPRAGLEAMSLGRAIIASDVPGCREIVKEGQNGFLVDVENAQALADAMKMFIKQTELVEQMGRYSRQFCEESFSEEKVTEIVLSAMKD